MSTTTTISKPGASLAAIASWAAYAATLPSLGPVIIRPSSPALPTAAAIRANDERAGTRWQLVLWRQAAMRGRWEEQKREQAWMLSRNPWR